MSAPAFVWALQRGYDLGLPTSARMVLIYLADKANGHREAWPCQETIADWTGLKERAVRLATRTLEQAGLIRCSYRGKLRLYYILRPANGEDTTPAPNAADMPANNAATARSSASGAAEIPARNADDRGSHRQNPTGSPAFNAKTPAPDAPNPSTNQEENLERAKEGKNLSDGKKEDGSPPSAPPAPAPPPQTTTTTGSNAYRRPGDKPPPDSFNDFLDAPSPAKALPAEIAQEIIHGDPLDLPVDPEYVRYVVAELKHELRMRAYPPRAATMSRDDQADAVTEKPRPKTYHLNANLLAQARKQAGIRATVDA